MLSVLVLFLTFGGVFFVSFTFTYNHSLIPSYLSSSKISKSAVNQHILQLAQKFNLHLIELKVDHEEETETMRSHVDNHVHAGGSASSGSSGTSSVEEIVVKSIFSLGLSLSAMLVVLILCELMDFLNSLARLFCFHLVINLIIALLTMVQPFIILSLSIFQRLAPPRGYLITLLVIFAVSYLSWFILLHKLGSLTLSYLPVTGSDRTIIEKKTNEISIAGITIMAILSGVGSMSTPYRQLPVLYNRYNRQVSRRNVTQLDLNNMIQSYNHTEALVAKRKQQLNSLQLKSGGTVYSGGGSDSPYSKYNENSSLSSSLKLGGIMNKVQSFASLTSLRKTSSEEAELTNEIESLQTLKNHIYDDFIKLMEKFQIQQHEEVKGTLIMNFIKWFDWGFGVYCIYRIINVILIKLPYQAWASSGAPKVINDDDEALASSDALAITISKIILSLTSLPITETQLVSQISFLLSGGLFLCSITNVVTTLRSFKKFLPSMGNYSTTSITYLKHLVISELLGVYVMSTALLIRTNLPENLSNQVSKILSLSGSAISNMSKKSKLSAIQEVEFIDNWFDKIFAITCIITLIVLLLRNYLDDDNNMDEYDEELMLEAGKIA